jgi:molybdate transport system regulatory protein
MSVYKMKRMSGRTETLVKGLSVRGRVWIEKDGELFVGKGRAILLDRIDKLGSISAAAKSMGLSYRNAWLWVDSMNQLSASPLVIKTTGGICGGSAKITDSGRAILKKYNKLGDMLNVYLEKEKPTL